MYQKLREYLNEEMNKCQYILVGIQELYPETFDFDLEYVAQEGSYDTLWEIYQWTFNDEKATKAEEIQRDVRADYSRTTPES